MDYFSSDYFMARDQFRRAADHAAWELETHPVAARGPEDQELTVDVAYTPAEPGSPTLLLTTGLHGPEGFFGAAVACALLRGGIWTAKRPDIRIVLVHALNPFGFSHLRRTDEENIDPNRNFLITGDSYRGSTAAYRQMDSWLNPQRQRAAFAPRLAWSAVRLGIPALKEAIAGGQHDFPRGLFYGGSAPSSTHRFLERNLRRWIENSSTILHLDFHTGLGRWSTHKLLADAEQIKGQAEWLKGCIDPTLIDRPGNRGIAYYTRGSLGTWCATFLAPARYAYFCAEFGTYPTWQVLAGLRAENQAHHWAEPGSPHRKRAKDRLKELFCPQSPAWRQRALSGSIELVQKALRGLAQGRGEDEKIQNGKLSGSVNASILSP